MRRKHDEQTQHKTARNESIPVAKNERNCESESEWLSAQSKTKTATTANFEHLKWKIEVSIILLLYHH